MLKEVKIYHIIEVLVGVTSTGFDLSDVCLRFQILDVCNNYCVNSFQNFNFI